MILDVITWNVRPEIFSVDIPKLGVFAIRWYGLLFASGFVFGYLILLKIFKKEGVHVKVLDSLTTYMVVGTVVGARLGHCLFYEPRYYLSNPVEIFKIWEGGLASHGAALFILLAIYIFTRKSDLSFFWILDRVVIIVALAGMFIRTGNLMNSEIFGYPTDLPWAFEFVRARAYYPLVGRHPTQIYEALSYLGLFVFLLWYYYKKDGKPKEGLIFGMFLVLLFSARFVLEFFKETQVAFENSLPLNMGQLLSIPFILTGLVLIFFARREEVPEDKAKGMGRRAWGVEHGA